MNKTIDLPRLTSGQRLALTGAIGLALALATYGAVGSYTAGVAGGGDERVRPD